MSNGSSIDDLINKLNHLYPDLGLDPNNFSGYFFRKELKVTDCGAAVKSKHGQTHIAITHVNNNMSLFPLVTSFEYLNGDKEYKDKFQKPEYITILNILKPYRIEATPFDIFLRNEIVGYKDIREIFNQLDEA